MQMNTSNHQQQTPRAFTQDILRQFDVGIAASTGGPPAVTSTPVPTSTEIHSQGMMKLPY